MAQATYITAAEVAESFDDRIIKQISSYSGSPQSSVSNSVVSNAIEKASAEIESFALRGGHYSTTDLSDMNTDDDWALKGLAAALTMKHLFRGKAANMPADMQAIVAEAQKTLEDLRDGMRVFPQNSASQTAGKAEVKIIDSYRRASISMISDSMFFPDRQDRKY